ncbi:GNAT family N-acetyltransferase [Clostridium formicaceticum]|uniref:Acetyltransferase n=1 Tax=Clostridium formicaceticum TaxID=1497 RepID=A0AAC9WGT1_9CLOT|nr:GNAT family N-acetyltransferase [Clostridium formicaceticum]AOY77723.1 GNAT family N-acetyltransferase [Clostridium formicaceticum]ARE88317.1 putative acetyltransferase [Clostridium formicaceticum]
MLEIRQIQKDDLNGLLELYTQLHNNPMPVVNYEIEELWRKILEDRNHHILVGCVNERIVSSCVVVIIPNLTHSQQPYALIENVITDEKCRGKGYATAILNYAKKLAIKENCYKMMLMTGSKKESTLNFYKQVGYNSEDKTGFVKWL